MKTYDLSLIGFGNVNRALVQIIRTSSDEIAREHGLKLRVVAISDLLLGSVISPTGIDLCLVDGIAADPGGFASLPGGHTISNPERIISEVPADFVVEATFTNPADGEPARSYCELALATRKHVVTTNKGPIALAGPQLKAAARNYGVSLGYEGTVMSGTPVLRFARELLPTVGISGFKGILNGTSNFVLERMGAGASLQEAVTEAQKLGYAEADPTADLAGYDVRLKVVILANEIFGGCLRPQDVSCEGITHLTPDLLTQAEANGRRWKLVGEAAREITGKITASVSPMMLPLRHALSGVTGATNAVSFETKMLGTVSLIGAGAGRVETAYALLSDIIAIDRTSGIESRRVAA